MAYAEKTASYAHQLKARTKARGRKGFAYLMEMGTGKTKTQIDELGEAFQEGHVEQALILAPNGVYSNWATREIPAHMPEEILDRTRLHLWNGGNTVGEKNKLIDLYNEDDKHGILNMNLEAISSSDRAWEIALRFVKKRPTAVIIDESTRIKNYDSIITKTAMRFRDISPMRRVLTGYPNPNGPMDLYSQLDFCEQGALGTSYFGFRNKYALMRDQMVGYKRLRDGRVVPNITKIITGYQNQGLLAERLEKHSFRALKKDCLDLPPETYSPPRFVEMTSEQRKAYKEMLSDCTTELAAAQYVTATMVLTQRLRLHQIVCGFVKLDTGVEVPIKNNRLRAMTEHVEEWCGRPGIVWCTYQHNIREVVAQLEKMHPGRVVQYHGGIDRVTCDENINMFQNGEADYFVATQQKGGFGITLTRGADDLFYSNTDNLEHRLQAEARTHRSGQKNPVNHGDLVCRDTVDWSMMQNLREKIDLGDTVLRDGWRKWVI